MSAFIASLSEKYHYQNEEQVQQFLIDYFNGSSRPFDELLENLLELSDKNDRNINGILIHSLLFGFRQWKDQSAIPAPQPNATTLKDLILHSLPVDSLKALLEIFPVSRENLLQLLRSSFAFPTNSHLYKRALKILVELDYQLELQPNEVLLPLLLSSKDHLIDVYLNKKAQYEEYLLRLLDLLYSNGGRHLRETLVDKYGMKANTYNKKAFSKLAVRYWNLYGHEQEDKYPNLAILQHKRTLGYLINVKYNAINDEKTMSDDCWNELVEEIVRVSEDLAEFLIDVLVMKDDLTAVRYWVAQLHRSQEKLPPSVQQYLHVKQNVPTATTQIGAPTASIDYYSMPFTADRIIFVDSMPSYQRLHDRLFRNESEDILIGFDCEWKPVFNNTSTSKQRISVMQIAFDDHVFLLDLLNFFHTCDSQTVQQRLATRLFDDDRVTLISYGFRSDAAMLIASYPMFDRALLSGKTLLDLSLVQNDLTHVQREIFPHAKGFDDQPSKDKGLSELVRLCFGRALNKSEQCSNWERRPLRRAQTLYAATDAYCLLDIYRFLAHHFQSSDVLKSFRGRKPKKMDSAIVRQIDENYQDKNESMDTLMESPGAAQVPSEMIRPSQAKFVVDNMLHGLGKELRVAGCDAVILGDDDPHTDAIRYARAENRIILSRGAPYNLLRSHAVEGRCWQPPLNLPAKQQCRAVLDHFNVQVLPEDIFSRCTLCNGNDYAVAPARDIRLLWCKMNNHSLETLEPELVGYQPELIDLERGTLLNEHIPLVLAGLTLKNYRSYDEFYICRQCGKVYWQGTHWQRRLNRDCIKSKGNATADDDSDDGIVFLDAESTL